MTAANPAAPTAPKTVALSTIPAPTAAFMRSSCNTKRSLAATRSSLPRFLEATAHPPVGGGFDLVGETVAARHPERQKGAEHMTTPEPIDDSYPASWRPRGAPPFEPEIEPTAAEAWLASLTDEEFFTMTKRVRDNC
jgi:hypothetical protein